MRLCRSSHFRRPEQLPDAPLQDYPSAPPLAFRKAGPSMGRPGRPVLLDGSKLKREEARANDGRVGTWTSEDLMRSRPPHKLDVQFSRIQLSRRRCPLSSDGRDQRDKIDKPELAIELAEWQRCPTQSIRMGFRYTQASPAAARAPRAATRRLCRRAAR